jgi:hypothetical protein
MVDNGQRRRARNLAVSLAGAEKMRRLLFIGLVCLAGCQGTVGPIKRTSISDPIDDPRLSIEEQQQRARDRLALPESGSAIGPRTYTGLP